MSEDSAMTIVQMGLPTLGLRAQVSRQNVQECTLHLLARALNSGRCMAFIGSGISSGCGYPSWVELTLEAVDKTKKNCRHLKTQQPEIWDVLSKFEKDTAVHKRNKASPNREITWSDRLLLILNLCEDTLMQNGQQPSLQSILANRIKEIGKKTESRNFDSLMMIMRSLRVRRFLTINYDIMIEEALCSFLGPKVKTMGAGMASMTVEDAIIQLQSREMENEEAPHIYSESPLMSAELVKFALGVPGYDCGVFHCHGSVLEPDSMVVTEKDYQALYLSDDHAHRSYRDALQLAFAANPILFLGVGMNEPDLLRALRQFVSEQEHGRRERSLFAVLPTENAVTSPEAVEFREHLYARYGVMAYFYQVKDITKTEDVTTEFCNQVTHISTEWRKWWLNWQKKPPIREPIFARWKKDDGSVNVYHHRAELSKDLFDRREGLKEVMSCLKGDPKSGEHRKGSDTKGRTVLVLGLPGTGKGGLGAELLKQGDYHKRFFATTHFTNDFLTILDGAADFLLGRKVANDRTPLERFAIGLEKSSGTLVVIGGLERLLVRASPSQILEGACRSSKSYAHPIPPGRASTQEIYEFLKICMDNGNRDGAHLVLTSSMMPVDVLKDSNVRFVELSGVDPEELQKKLPFKGACKEEAVALLEQLHKALRGHAYALAVVLEALRNINKNGKRDFVRRVKWLREIVTRLTAVDLPRRPELTIRLVLDWLRFANDDTDETSGSDYKKLDAVMRKVAMFTVPVSSDVVRIWCQAENREDTLAAIEDLSKRHLLLEIQRGPDQKEAPRYTAHTVVRKHVLRALQHVPDVTAEPNHFYLNGFSVDTDSTQTGTPESYGLLGQGIDHLLSHVEKMQSSKHMRRYSPNREWIRAIYGLLRTHWPATNIGRLEKIEQNYNSTSLKRSHYEAYFLRLARFLNVLRGYEQVKRLWNSCDDVAEHKSVIGDKKSVLYSGELAWLYNEMGLVGFCQGHVTDAYGYVRLAQDISAVCDRGQRSYRWCQMEINLALVQMERANLSKALYHLDNARRTASRLKDDSLKAQAGGYSGLIYHLSGEIGRADKCYQKAIETSRKIDNKRAQSIFGRHRSDLLRKMGEYDKAEQELRKSISVAESGRHYDLLHFARVAEANLRLADSTVDSHHGLSDAFEYARRIGIPKLEADVLKIQGHIALYRGEVEEASRLALHCLAISAENDMQLRVTAGLVFLGRVARIRGDQHASDSLLRSAIELGRRQGYMLQVECAEQQLMHLGSSQDGRSWGSIGLSTGNLIP